MLGTKCRSRRLAVSRNWSPHVASRTPARTIAPPTIAARTHASVGGDAQAREAGRADLRQYGRINHQRGSGMAAAFVMSRANKAVSAAEAKRLASLAVPPAYEDVLYAADPKAHIQAIGRDAAGRLQYRYHPDWQRVRETAKGAPAGAARRGVAAHPPQHRPASRRWTSRHAPSRCRPLSSSWRALPSGPAPSNMRGCAARAARRRC